jgi:hypothetical protein
LVCANVHLNFETLPGSVFALFHSKERGFSCDAE